MYILPKALLRASMFVVNITYFDFMRHSMVSVPLNRIHKLYE